MKKTNATLLLIVLLGFTAAAWFGVISGQAKDQAAYKDYIKRAETFEKKGIYVDALDNYKKAFELDQGNFEIALKIADMYGELGDRSGFIASCEDAIKINEKNPVPYVKEAEYYISKFRYADAIDVMEKAPKAVRESEQIKALQAELSTKAIEKYVSFAKVADWHVQGDVNYVAAQEDGRWGMAIKDGTKKIRFIYDAIGAYDGESGVIPCSFEGVWYYIDLNGNKKLISDEAYQYLGSFGNGLAPAVRDNKYGYIDADFNEKNFEYEYAGAFANKVAAVKKDGKWALIGDKLNMVTGFDYDEILMDSNGYCSVFDVIVARKGQKYFFIDHKGNQIGKGAFDEAALPASDDSYIAVRDGAKWGFADQKGEIAIPARFDGAKSFSMGLAPVKTGDNWGYIDGEGKMVIEAKYSDAGVFSADGSAPVESHSTWNFIVLCGYDK